MEAFFFIALLKDWHGRPVIHCILWVLPNDKPAIANACCDDEYIHMVIVIDLVKKPISAAGIYIEYIQAFISLLLLWFFLWWFRFRFR